MFEPAYSLFQFLGVAFFALLFGMCIGIPMGKSVQRKHDVWMFGPRHMRTGKPPVWASSRSPRSGRYSKESIYD